MKKRRKPFNKDAALHRIKNVMRAASVETQDDEVHRWLATTAYTILQKLTTGQFDLGDHIMAVKLNTFACLLAFEIMPGLDNAGRTSVAAHHAQTVRAADCLYQIRDRYEKTGRFGATGKELTTIRESFTLLDSIVSYANKGETIRAMRKLDEMFIEYAKRNHVPEPQPNRSPDRAGSHEAGRA